MLRLPLHPIPFGDGPPSCEVELNFCHTCGVALQLQSRFCGHCGAALNAAPSLLAQPLAPSSTTQIENEKEQLPAGSTLTDDRPEVPAPPLWRLFKPAVKVCYESPGNAKRTVMMDLTKVERFQEQLELAGGRVVSVDDSQDVQRRARKITTFVITGIVAALAITATVAVKVTSPPAGWSRADYRELEEAVEWNYFASGTFNISDSWVDCVTENIAESYTVEEFKTAQDAADGDAWFEMRRTAVADC